MMRVLLITAIVFLFWAPSVRAAGTSFYVDCALGNDSNSGTSPSSAWRSLSKAGSATLSPGDNLLFKRNCTWSGTLHLNRSGTSSAPILISAYDSGADPEIANTQNNTHAVRVSGSYLVIENLTLKASPPSRDSNCQNAGMGYMLGLSFESGSSFNTVQNVVLTGHYAGAYIRSGSHHNKILHSRFTDNNMMHPLDTTSGNDAGAFGVLLHGDFNEIGYNEFRGQRACSYDYTYDGGAIELYGGQGNHIHHNRAINNNNFSELGNPRTRDTLYAYNMVYSPLPWSSFLTTRGAKSKYGPVYNTQLYNNTVLLTGPESQGIVCHAGCSAQLLKMRNNIISAVLKSGYADAPFDEANNIYWGGPRQFTLGSNSLTVDPKFVNSSTGDLHLRSDSPAINSGTSDPLSLGHTTDLDGTTIPLSTVLDRGAYEFNSGPKPTTMPAEACAADISKDGLVDLTDYSLLGRNFLKSPFLIAADINQDSLVDLRDYSILVRNFFQTCTRPI